LCRFNQDASPQAGFGAPDAPQKFVVYYPGEEASARTIEVIYEDHSGTIWCGTGAGLFRLDRLNGQWGFTFVDIIQPAAGDVRFRERAILEDHRGSLWIRAESGLYRRRPDGVVEVYAPGDGLPIQNAMLEDRMGTSFGGAMRLAANGFASYKESDGLGGIAIGSIFENRAGELCVITGNRNLNRLDGGRF
jgi:ligand-binding sensor domain-containing protein